MTSDGVKFTCAAQIYMGSSVLSLVSLNENLVAGGLSNGDLRLWDLINNAYTSI